MTDEFVPLSPLTGGSPRDFLKRRGFDHRDLSERDAIHLAYVLIGFVLRTPADSGPITGIVWLASALTTGGRYETPQSPGHPADLRDGGSLVDSAVLMAVVQRHFRAAPDSSWTDEKLAWTDEKLAQDLGLQAEDIRRAQHLLDGVSQILRRPARLGARWWEMTDERLLEF